MYSFTRLNEHLDKFIEMGVPSFDIKVLYKGDEVFRRMHGYSDYDKTVPINGKELYNIYSCSKPITCTAAMTLFDKGKFSLEDKLSDYMPEFTNMKVQTENGLRDAVRPIRIIDLFTMSAGFTYNLRSENLLRAVKETNGASTVETMKYLALDPLVFEPGEKFLYSLCHDVIAALVEVISGEKFGDYVKREIFDKAGMTETTYLPDENTKKKLCAQYRFENGTYVPIGDICTYRLGENYESGGAGVVSSVDDYVRFLEAFRTGKLISDKARELMITSKLTVEQLSDYGIKSIGYGYGLGVRCPLTPDSRSTSIGWGGAAAAHLGCDIKKGITYYYAQHVLGSPNQAMRNDIAFLIEEDLGIEEKETESVVYKEKLTY